MRILVLGGTVFVGRHIVDAALARGHEVTLFHRGRHPSHRPGDVAEVLGDRTRDLDALDGSWDAVVDTSGSLPADVAAAAAALGPRSERYVFISSASVYADLSTTPVTEDAPTHPPLAEGDPSTQDYGPLKVGCEQEVERALPGRALILRAGLLVGPHDPTGRFTYWVQRIAKGGEVLAPRVPDAPVQVLDARDLGEWVVALVESGAVGVSNAPGPLGEHTWADLLATCAEVAGSDAEITWVDERWLLDRGVKPWLELPLWLPDELQLGGMMALDDRRARSLGLRWRSLRDTVADTLAWVADAGDPAAVDYGTRISGAGLDPARERELLAAWHRR